MLSRYHSFIHKIGHQPYLRVIFYFLWRWLFNFKRTYYYQFNKRSSMNNTETLSKLKISGITIHKPSELFDASGLKNLDIIDREVKDKLNTSTVKDYLADNISKGSTKEFRMPLLPNEFKLGGPYIQLAIQPQMLQLASAYLGMQAYLREVSVWLDVATTGEPQETQFWHRDYVDLMNFKVFIYLNEVSESNGPFCFIPGTHGPGNRKISVKYEPTGRVVDQEMEKVVARDQWFHCVAPAKTVVIADTSGFHKGLKLVQGHRILLLLQYTSGKPWHSRGFQLHQNEKAVTLTADQTFALFAHP